MYTGLNIDIHDKRKETCKTYVIVKIRSRRIEVIISVYKKTTIFVNDVCLVHFSANFALCVGDLIKTKGKMG